MLRADFIDEGNQSNENARLSSGHYLRDHRRHVLHDVGRLIADIHARLHSGLVAHSPDARDRRRRRRRRSFPDRLVFGPPEAITAISSRRLFSRAALRWR